MTRSRQGFRVAFVGMIYRGQTACAEYLKRQHQFKRADLDEPLKSFLRASYNLKGWTNIPVTTRMEFYDAIHAVDPDFFINNLKYRLSKTLTDTVIWDVRYVNELIALKEMDFIICRVTTGAKPIHLKKYVRKAESGTVAVAMTYDSNFAFRKNVDYSIDWSKWQDTKPAMEAFLERIGYKT